MKTDKEEGKKTTFAALSKTTTRKQQQHEANFNLTQTDPSHETPTEPVDNLARQSPRLFLMKLEEKKRQIELKKKRMEMLRNKQWQEVGKAAFLQAVGKGSGVEACNPDSATGKEVREFADREADVPPACNFPSILKTVTNSFSVQKWFHATEMPVPDSTCEFSEDSVNETDIMTSTKYLDTDFQADISRISLQQELGINDSSLFFLPSLPMDSSMEPSPSRSQMCQNYVSPLLPSRQGGFQLPSSAKPTVYHQTLGDSPSYSILTSPSSHLRQTCNEENLYSRVIKLGDRQAPSSSRLSQSPPLRQQASGHILTAVSCIDQQQKPASSKTLTEIHEKAEYKLKRTQTEYASSKEERSNFNIPEDNGLSSDDTSDTAAYGFSVADGDYAGPKLFVKLAAKSNRGIITSAINTVLAGVANADTKKKVMEEMNRSGNQHFLILFRDTGYQFRALYTYNQERGEATRLYGIGPKSIEDKMMEKFYKYNSSGKCFSEIQTNHLTPTIDAFTIPNGLWAGKKVIPSKREF